MAWLQASQHVMECACSEPRYGAMVMPWSTHEPWRSLVAALSSPLHSPHLGQARVRPPEFCLAGRAAVPGTRCASVPVCRFHHSQASQTPKWKTGCHVLSLLAWGKWKLKHSKPIQTKHVGFQIWQSSKRSSIVLLVDFNRTLLFGGKKTKPK